MQARVISLSIAGVVLVIAAACSTPRNTPTIAMEKPAPRTSASYVFAQGQSVTLAPDTTLKLERVNDSRCRTGAVCVWAGYISYSFVLSDKSGSSNFVLADDMPGAVKSITRNGLTFTLEGLEPAAPPALKAPTPDYRVSLRVNISQPS